MQIMILAVIGRLSPTAKLAPHHDRMGVLLVRTEASGRRRRPSGIVRYASSKSPAGDVVIVGRSQHFGLCSWLT
jgi:hypothetical protein